MPGFLFDSHAHFSFKPANSDNFNSSEEPDEDHWRERFRRKEDFSGFTHFADKTVIKSSQIHGDDATLSGHRIVINGLYPLERGFISSLFLKALATLTGFSRESLRQLNDHKKTYFEMMQREYDNVKSRNGDPTFAHHGNRYRLVNSYSEIIRNLSDHPNDINILHSVEGGHCFADDVRDENGQIVDLLRAEKRHIRSLIGQGSGDDQFKEYIKGIIDNIDTVKRTWQFQPLFVGLSHHYYNHIAGHSESLTGLVDFLLNQDGASIDFGDQILNFYYIGIRRGWGYAVVHKLLSRKTANGQKARRFLIDIKHMSPQARVDYYKLVDHMLQLDPNERVPIIASHIAVSGRKELQRTIDNDHKKFNDEVKPSKYFYDGVINLFDDEIRRIVESDGLMGMMIDERRIMGRFLPPESGFEKKGDFNKIARKSRSTLTRIVKCKHKMAWVKKELEHDPDNTDLQQELAALQNELAGYKQDQREYADKLRPVYLSVIYRQIFHILDQTGQKGWDHICLGTDYDGVINPIDIYPQSQDMSDLRGDLIAFWEDIIQHGSSEEKALYSKHLYGHSPDVWVEKFCFLNGLNFLKKYFNDAYLRDGILPSEGYVLTSNEESVVTG